MKQVGVKVLRNEVVIEGEEKYKVEKILNKKKFRGKDKYLVQEKGYITKEDTWET